MREATHTGDGSSASVPDDLAGTLRELDPAYFGLVMSTGIVAVAFRELGVGTVASPLAAFTVACYVLLGGFSP